MKPRVPWPFGTLVGACAVESFSFTDASLKGTDSNGVFGPIGLKHFDVDSLITRQIEAVCAMYTDAYGVCILTIACDSDRSNTPSETV